MCRGDPSRSRVKKIRKLRPLRAYCISILDVTTREVTQLRQAGNRRYTVYTTTAILSEKPWFSILMVGTASIPGLLKEPYGRIVNLEFESLGMSVTEMYHF